MHEPLDLLQMADDLLGIADTDQSDHDRCQQTEQDHRKNGAQYQCTYIRCQTIDRVHAKAIFLIL